MTQTKPAARFSVLRPSASSIRRFVTDQRDLPFNYAAVGATRTIGIPGTDAARGDYNLDRRRHRLGSGAATYASACAAMRRWRMFDVGWIDLCWPDTRICPGSAIAVLARVARGYILNAARIVYVVDETGPVDRFGFAHGTLPGHVIRGEERFLVEWNRADNSVWFEVAAISKPHHLVTWLSYPLVRRLQARFREHAIAAMSKTTR